MSDYWNRKITRRRAIAATGATAMGAAFLAACGGGSSSSGGGGGAGGTQNANVRTEKLDPKSGKPGGKLLWQSYGDPGGGLELLKIRNVGVYNMASFTHEGLLDYAYGVQGYPGIGTEVLPSLATALPEPSPDKLKFTFKIRQGVKFHNGRTMTAEDVKWTFDTLAFAPTSPWRGDFNWMDKTETPDASTFVVTTKFPFADFLQSMTFKNAGAILAREHQESAESERRLVGTGPYTFVEYTPPTVTKYRRNPEYWGKPLGFFDEVERLGTADKEKMISDFISKQVHVTYWFSPKEKDRIRQARPDAILWNYPQAGGHNYYMRVDKAPFNDKRVRQALSMAINRKSLIGPMTNGEGEPEGLMSIGSPWKFRKASELKSAKNFEYNVAEAKKLLAAAGVQTPIRIGEVPTWNPTVIGPEIVDGLTLILTGWKNDGIGDGSIKEETFGQFSPRLVGTFDNTIWGPNTQATNPDIGNTLKNKYYWPADAVEKPVLNSTWVKNSELNTLLDKQIQEFDKDSRQSVLTQIEDLVNEEMYHISSIEGRQNYFGDPALRNAQMPRDAFNGGFPWFKYWWFDRG